MGKNNRPKIGIFSGSFDPVHAGHIAFALQAAEAAGLDEVYLAPEIKPRRKEGVTHIAHRLKMLEIATAAHPKLRVLDLPDKNFSIKRTLPRLQARFRGAKLYYLCGSDMVMHMHEWELIERLLEQVGLVVGVRSGADTDELHKALAALSATSEIFVLSSKNPEISSFQIRETLRAGKSSKHVLKSIGKYIDQNWLYHKSLND